MHGRTEHKAVRSLGHRNEAVDGIIDDAFPRRLAASASTAAAFDIQSDVIDFRVNSIRPEAFRHFHQGSIGASLRMRASVNKRYKSR